MKNKVLGMTLIEVVLSMWIFGIVVISVMSLSIGGINKHNQARLYAVSVLRSEFERCRMNAELASGLAESSGGAKGYAAVIVSKDSSKAYYEKKDKSSLSESFCRFEYLSERDYSGTAVGAEMDRIEGMSAYDFQKYMFETAISCSENNECDSPLPMDMRSAESLMKGEHGLKCCIVAMKITGNSNHASYESSVKDALITVYMIDYDSKGNIKKSSVSMKGTVVSDRAVL